MNDINMGFAGGQDPSIQFNKQQVMNQYGGANANLNGGGNQDFYRPPQTFGHSDG